MVAGGYPNDVVRPPLYTVAVGATLPTTHGELVDLVATNLFGRPLPPRTRRAVLAFLGAKALSPLSADSSAALVAARNFVAVLLLDSPYQTAPVRQR